jgi:spore coat protein U-like protein
MFSFINYLFFTNRSAVMKRTYVMKRMMILAGVLSVAAMVAPANATTTKTATFLVSLTINSDCSISTSPLAFGSSGVLAAAINQSTSLTVTCSNTTPYSLGLDAGSVSGSTVATRLLSNGTATVNFQLYSDTNHSVLWGNTVGVNTVSGVGNGSAQSVTVYGQVAAQATPTASTYTSTVTASVIF